MVTGLMGGPAGFGIKGRVATIYGSGNNLACWTPLPIMADTVVKMLLEPDQITNRSVFISGVQGLTQNTILEALEAETGCQFKVTHVDITDFKNNAVEAFEKGETRMGVRSLAIYYNFNEKDSKANFWDRVENKLLGVKAVSVREAVKAAMEAEGGGN
jgi:hypothetical protein